uniref:Retrovirus-related Pol polyprotein from transposon TNT 1-94 n=1 Tax=Lygus hesperus TaxID=30085 RepID=A0A0K8SC80_LYGHE
MNSSVKIEPLGRNNFDTWRIHIEALLIKTGGWDYVTGQIKKPTVAGGDADGTAAAAKEWSVEDLKARSDLILSISPSELKLIKGCQTSNEVWTKLHEVYQSKGPARKATLLKRLILHRMKIGDDVRDHVSSFFETVDKLSDMDIAINDDLLSIMLLYSLPEEFENFRCAIESRDDLPKPDALRTKILEESDARKTNLEMMILMQ